MTAIKETGEPTSIPSIYRAIKRMLKMGAIVSVPIPNAPSVYTVKTNPAIAAGEGVSMRDGALCGFSSIIHHDGRVELVDRYKPVLSSFKSLLQCYFYEDDDFMPL